MNRSIAIVLPCLFLLAALLSSNGCSLSSNERLISKLTTIETSRGKIVNQINSFWLSPDGKRLAYIYNEPVERKPGQMSVNPKSSIVVDGSRGRQYDNIQWFVFSPDSKRYAYVATKDNKFAVVVDGAEGKSYDYPPFGPDRDHPILFSPDSKHVAYCAMTGPKSYVVVKDSVEGKQYDKNDGLLTDLPIMFSPDSKTLVYIGSLQEPGKNWGWFKQVVVQNGVEGKRYNQVHSLTFSADSQHFTYLARDDTINGPRRYRILDGSESQMFASAIDPAPIRFSLDGKRMLILQGTLTVDGVEIDKRVDQAIFSPDSQRIAYVKSIDWNKTYGGAAYLVGVDGHEEGPYRSMPTNITFSPDSQRIAYVASASMDAYERRLVVVVDGQSGKPYDWGISNLTFSPDSKHLAYIANTGPQDGRIFVVSDGTEGPLYSHVANPVFSTDGRLAYVVTKANINKSFVVVSGVEGKYYTWVSRPTFSPDGKHVVYFAREGNDFFAVVDGVEMKHYERIFGHEAYPYLSSSDDKTVIVFDTDSSFHYLAQSGENIYLVKETIK